MAEEKMSPEVAAVIATMLYRQMMEEFKELLGASVPVAAAAVHAYTSNNIYDQAVLVDEWTEDVNGPRTSGAAKAASRDKAKDRADAFAYMMGKQR